MSYDFNLPHDARRQEGFSALAQATVRLLQAAVPRARRLTALASSTRQATSSGRAMATLMPKLIRESSADPAANVGMRPGLLLDRYQPRAVQTTMRYTPKTIHEVRRCIAGFSSETRVEVEDGIPVKARTVADLRALSTWPAGDWVLDVPIKGNQWSSVVRIEGRPTLGRGLINPQP